ncbi:hypothetical protein [uncultured Variovorax sp.]|uniref:hypothetical protein n=1 Tax=uncultured Variovorax sp. TaxID=114708 RepID=UPI0025F2D750|nr:hypothetical protein [uncultured Variovorax sp.]
MIDYSATRKGSSTGGCSRINIEWRQADALKLPHKGRRSTSSSFCQFGTMLF